MLQAFCGQSCHCHRSNCGYLQCLKYKAGSEEGKHERTTHSNEVQSAVHKMHISMYFCTVSRRLGPRAAHTK